MICCSRCLVLALMTISVFSCAPKVAERVSTDEFEVMIEKVPKLQLVDVRTPDEFEQGYIPAAMLIDFKSPDFKEQLKVLKKRRPVAIYCRSGNRSGQAFEILKAMGFRKIYDLEGGITAWQQQGKVIKK